MGVGKWVRVWHVGNPLVEMKTNEIPISFRFTFLQMLIGLLSLNCAILEVHSCDRQLCPKFDSLGPLFEGRLHENAIRHKEAPPFGFCIWLPARERLLVCWERTKVHFFMMLLLSVASKKQNSISWLLFFTYVDSRFKIFEN